MNFFVAGPEWGFWIVTYFFLGGIASGAYFIAVLIEWFGAEEDRSLARVAQLHKLGQTKAHLYGADDKVLGGLNAFYLLMDKPEVYGLPSNPIVPSSAVPRSFFWSLFTGLLVALGVLFQFRRRPSAPDTPEARP